MATPSAQALISDLKIPNTAWKMPVVIAIFGLPCAGKTQVAQYLADRHPLLRLTTDVLRLKYGFASGPDTLAMMFQIADNLLPQKISIMFDGIHPRAQNRAEVRALANRHAAGSHIIFVTAEQGVITQRLQERLEQPEETVAAGKFIITPEHFDRLAGYLELPAETETDVVTVDTTESKIEAQLSWLDARLADCYL